MRLLVRGGIFFEVKNTEGVFFKKTLSLSKQF
jgi:hypothetical protein